jgi:phosphate transport system substrate-binding protein
MRGFARAALAAALLVLAAASANAERIELNDSSVLFGEIVSLKDDIYTVRMKNGTEFRLPRNKIRQISSPAAPRVPVPAAASNQSAGVLRFSGSNTIGEDLLPSLVEGYVAGQGGGSARWVPDKRSIEKTLTPAISSARLPSVIQIAARGTATAFPALKNGKADVGMASRAIRQDELVQLAALGDMTAPESEHVIGLDGVAVVVNSANPLRELDRDQIAAIFSGAVADWSAVGGTPGPIRVYSRNAGSGTYDAFVSLILGSRAMVGSALPGYDSSEALADAVAGDPAAIGFIGQAYARQAKPIAIRECSLAYLPTAFSVKTGEYPLSRQLFLYTPSRVSPHAAAFVSYVLSPGAQDLMARSGFVDLSIEPDRTNTQVARRIAVVEETPADIRLAGNFLKATEQATRLSVTFRFRSDSSALDTRSVTDVARLAAYMKGPDGQGKNLLLLGFSDASGDGSNHVALSAARAAKVASLLSQAGVRASFVKGYGSLAPVACNSGIGRERNRRVEAWVK